MNKNVYEYENAEVEKMLKDLRRSVDRFEKAYSEAQEPSSNGKPKATVNKLPNYFNK